MRNSISSVTGIAGTQAVEQSERPWLILLASMSALSAVLLAIVLWRLHAF